MAYTKYSLTPANNNATPPDGAPEGMLPSAVNDTMRDMMAQIRDVGDGIRNGTYTMTAPVITGGSITGVALSGNTFTNPVITGGSINNTPIGASTANTGAFTTLSASGATTFSGATVVSGSLTANTFSSSGATITGGSINSTAIGGSTAAAGAFTTLSASGVATFSAGTVSAPALTTTGDTNTGIFFPAADTIAFTEGGVESMRIDSSGNVGIGTSSPNSKLDVRGAIESGNGTIRTAITFATTGIVGTLSNHALSLYTNDAERMRIHSSGGVSIGNTTDPTANTLSVGPRDTSSNDGVIRIDGGSGVGGEAYLALARNGTSNLLLITDGSLTEVRGIANIPLTFRTNDVERMRINSSGNVGIGTNSPSSIGANYTSLDIRGSSGGGLFMGVSGGTHTYMYTDAGGSNMFTSAAIPLQFGTNGTERMRITSGGNVAIGSTGLAGNERLRVVQVDNSNTGRFEATNANQSNDVVQVVVSRNTTNNSYYAYTYYNSGAGVNRFQVADSGNVTNTNGSYGTISDVKNKENIVDATSKLDKVNQLKVRNYNFKGDDLKQIGFVAQEFEQVFPSMIEEHKDTDAEGNDLGTTTKSIKTSVLVPILVKAIQEQQAMIEELKQEVALLKSK